MSLAVVLGYMALFHAEIKQSNAIRALKTADHQAVSKVFL